MTLADFIRARHPIYLKRLEGLPAPWTEDKILATGRFCNVYRELDTVTIWIRKNIREPYADDEHLWMMLAIARTINWPPTLQRLIDTDGAWPSHEDYDPANMTRVLEKLAARGDKVYTGAYMIRAESDTKVEWFSWSKHRYICEIVLGKLWEWRDDIREQVERPGASLQSVWSFVKDDPYFTGWGAFMTYEWVTDLRHTRYLSSAPDIMTWANAGPGAIRGLNRIYGRDLKAHPKPEQTNEEMKTLLTWLTIAERITPLEMRDVEHCLCEFDKYQRVLLGEGKMRSKYNYSTATRITA